MPSKPRTGRSALAGERSAGDHAQGTPRPAAQGGQPRQGEERRAQPSHPASLPRPGGGVAVNRFTQCSTDTFSVSNPDGPNPPAICGTNSNEHSEFFMTVLLKTF